MEKKFENTFTRVDIVHEGDGQRDEH